MLLVASVPVNETAEPRMMVSPSPLATAGKPAAQSRNAGGNNSGFKNAVTQITLPDN